VRPNQACPCWRGAQRQRANLGCGLWSAFKPTMSPRSARSAPSTGGQNPRPDAGLVLPGEAWEAADQRNGVFLARNCAALGAGGERDQPAADRPGKKWAASRLACVLSSSPCLGENNRRCAFGAGPPAAPRTLPAKGAHAPLLDELDENSHKHAYEVSAISNTPCAALSELLGNGRHPLARSRNEGVFKGKTDAEQNSTRECLVTCTGCCSLLYNREPADLGYAPMGSDVYRPGLQPRKSAEMTLLSSPARKDPGGQPTSADSLQTGCSKLIWEGLPQSENDANSPAAPG